MNNEDFQIINKIYQLCNKFNKTNQIHIGKNKI